MWDDFAEQDKIEREKIKYPAQETLGFRIIGMRVCVIQNHWNGDIAVFTISGMRVCVIQNHWNGDICTCSCVHNLMNEGMCDSESLE